MKAATVQSMKIKAPSHPFFDTKPLVPSCSTVEENVDYVGNDTGSILSAAAEGCCSICNCFSAYTWTDHGGGTCWMS